MLEGRLARARQAIRTRSRSTKYTEQDYGNIATTRFSYFIIATRNYWHALIFATVRTWKISKIPPKSARIELPGHIKISILTKCGVRVVYPETVTILSCTGYERLQWWYELTIFDKVVLFLHRLVVCSLHLHDTQVFQCTCDGCCLLHF